MSFFSIFLALIIEQARPMSPTHFLHQWLRRWADWVASHVDGGSPSQAWLAWGLLVGVPAGLAVLIHWILAYSLGWLFAVAWNVALLYITLGFRQFSHHFTAIREALENGDEIQARELLAQWQQVQVGQIPRSEIVRHVIEFSMIAAHRHVFGVFFWYALIQTENADRRRNVSWRDSREDGTKTRCAASFTHGTRCHYALLLARSNECGTLPVRDRLCVRIVRRRR